MTGASAAPAYERRWETRGERRRQRAERSERGERGERGRSAADEARASYYGIPPIHKPHWKWLVITYFFLGGIAGGAYAVASVAEALGDPAHRRIARAGRYLSLAALAPCPVLLILDLGRPERFHHMLRILKIRSPMSVGTWTLTVFGGFCALSALIQAAQDGLLGRTSAAARLLRALPSRAIGLLGAAPALFVGGYTGVLLAATAVPLWTRSALLMGPLFLASAMSNATAALTLVLSLAGGASHRRQSSGAGLLRRFPFGGCRTGHEGLPGEAIARLERLERIALCVELALLLAHRARLGPAVRRPLEEGRLGRLHRTGVLGAGILLPLALHSQRWLTGRGLSRLGSAMAAALVLAGGFLFRYVMVMAGRESADDPEATFALRQGPGSRLAADSAPPARATSSAPHPAG